MGDVGRAGARRELDQLAAIDVEQQHDLPQRVGDRAVDLGRGQIDEARGQVREQPLELREILGGGSVAGKRRSGQNGYPWTRRRYDMRVTRALCLLIAGAVAAAAAPGVHAQASPRHPLRILVPLPPGSTSDVVARLIGERLSDGGAPPVVIDNRAGASGRIAVEALKASTADGGTLLLAPVAVPVVIPIVFKDASYDPAKDLVPVAQVATFEYALAVGASHPARDLAGFVAWARAHPRQANFGSAGAGSIPHFLGMMLGRAAGIDLLHVGYRGAPALEIELMGGQLAAGVSASSDFVPLHRTGKLRILATSGARRSRLVPEVPTFRELGYRSLEVSGWHGVFAPARTPQPTIDQLSASIGKALQSPALREKLAGLGIEPTGTTPEQLGAIIAADTVRWRAIVKATGFTAE
jgi:tripartite-type tricarboxylate transporter receptor subunit TctC